MWAQASSSISANGVLMWVLLSEGVLISDCHTGDEESALLGVSEGAIPQQRN